eukprot:c29242_g1_i2 orf=978-2300(-)
MAAAVTALLSVNHHASFAGRDGGLPAHSSASSISCAYNLTCSSSPLLSPLSFDLKSSRILPAHSFPCLCSRLVILASNTGGNYLNISTSLLSCRGRRQCLVQHLRGMDILRSGRVNVSVVNSSPLKDGSREVLHEVQCHTPRLDLHEPASASDVEVEGQHKDDSHLSEGSNGVDVVASQPSLIDTQGQQVSPSTGANEQEGQLLSGDTALKGSLVAGLILVGVVGGFSAVGYMYREQINDVLIQFSDFLEGYGPAGYVVFVAVYAGLEILAIPAIPLTMSAGLLFGNVTGTIIVSISGTVAATVAFLIARYLARDRILKLAEGNKKFLAIDKVIGEEGFRVVTLLRLSPLLPFSLGNYLYGLTSVKLVPYVFGSWLGMLPGTWVYVSAGALGRAFIQQEAETGTAGSSEQLWMVGLGLLATVFAASYITRLAKDAVKGLD